MNVGISEGNQAGFVRNPVRIFEDVVAEIQLDCAIELVDEWIKKEGRKNYEVSQGAVLAIVRNVFEDFFENNFRYPVGEMLKVLPKYATHFSTYWVHGKPNQLEFFFAYCGLLEIMQDDVQRRMKTYGSL